MLGVVDGSNPEDVVVPVVSHDIIGKLMIQCSREIGLSQSFAALMCFAGSECYFSAWNSGEGHYDNGVTGKRFQDICYCFTNAAVLGVRFANPMDPKLATINPAGKPFLLNPDGDYVLQYGDRLLVVAEDNDTYEYGPSNANLNTPVPPFSLPPKEPERLLLSGWRRDMDDMINELDKWVPAGSFLTLFNLFSIDKQLQKLAMGGLELAGDSSQTIFDARGLLENITQIELVCGDPVSGRQLDRLGPKKLPEDADDRLMGGTRYRLEEYHSTLVLCKEAEDCSNGMSPDSSVMAAMLVSRFIQVTRGVPDAFLVAEIKNPKTQDLMSYTQCTDAVVGNQILAMILAQISEDRDLGYVFDDLFSEEGMEMHVKDIRLFVGPQELLNWWDLLDRCQQRGMLPIGWIRKNGDHKSEWEVELNPADKNAPLAWEGRDAPDGDLLVVISLD